MNRSLTAQEALERFGYIVVHIKGGAEVGKPFVSRNTRSDALLLKGTQVVITGSIPEMEAREYWSIGVLLDGLEGILWGTVTRR